MGLIQKGLSIIHFDETYLAQQRLQHYSHDHIDFQQMEYVNLYCDEDSFITLKRGLQKRTQKGITFIGSGNYHYVTYILLKEITKPFTLILFDNHPDLGTGQDLEGDLLSCGTWVSHALTDIPLLQQVVIIGPTINLEHYPTHPRVVIYPFDGIHHDSLHSILSAIPTESVYISVDKDVLHTSDALTNWDHGMMDIDTLTHFLEHILNNKQAEGVDICGEVRSSPVHRLLPDYQSIIRKNEKANLKLLQTFLKTRRAQTKGA